MKYIVHVIFISIYLVSCNTNTENTIMQIAHPFPVVIDTAKFEKNGLLVDEEEITWLSTAHYPFLYIGVWVDTIIVDHQLRFGFRPPSFTIDSSLLDNENKPKKPNFQKYYIDWEDKRSFMYGKKSDIDIKVDTTNKVNDSYLILLTNNAKDTIGIGYGDILPLIMEAKDSTGLWKPIEERYIYMCGNGVGTIILPPNEIVLSSTSITHGSFSTELRLSYGDNHSQSFKGMINYRQFESRFDANGNYKEEYEREKK